MINGRSNVGDSQSRRLLAVLDLKQNKTLWADASGVRRQREAGEGRRRAGPAPRGLEPARVLGRRRHCLATVRSQDNHDRWLVTIDPATGKATSIDNLHDDAWIREGAVRRGTGGGGFGGGGFGGGGITWLPDNKRVLYPGRARRLDAPLLARRDGRQAGAEAADDRQVGDLERAAVERPHEGLLHRRARCTRASTTSTRCRSTAARSRASRPRPAATRSPCRPTRRRSSDLFSTINRPPELFVHAVRGRRAGEAGHDDADGRVAGVQVDRAEGHHLQGARRRRWSTPGSTRRR